MARLLKIAISLGLILAQVSVISANSLVTLSERPEPELKWRSTTIPLAISTSLLRPASNIKHGTDMVSALKRSLRKWEATAGIEFREYFTDKQSVSPANSGDGVSLITIAATAENALLFVRNGEEVAATTRLFHDGRGRITEADIVLNPYKQFSSDGTFGTFDVEATLTHEIGHVLGLEHSFVRGSAMYESFGANGLFGLHGFAQRTLSDSDRTAVRAKYGIVEGDENCCGSLSTRVFFPDGRPAANLDIWIEDSETGRLSAQARTNADGTAEVTGLTYGTYTLFASRKERARRSIPSQELGRLSVSADGSPHLVKRLSNGSDDVELMFTGFNGQLTVNSVPINSGKAYTVYIGGRNLDSKGISVRFSSPFLELTPGSLVILDYGEELSVLSFEVSASSETPVGEYTVFVESQSGGRSAVPGAIAVRDFLNPYSNLVLEGK